MGRFIFGVQIITIDLKSLVEEFEYKLESFDEKSSSSSSLIFTHALIPLKMPLDNLLFQTPPLLEQNTNIPSVWLLLDDEPKHLSQFSRCILMGLINQMVIAFFAKKSSTNLKLLFELFEFAMNHQLIFFLKCL